MRRLLIVGSFALAALAPVAPTSAYAPAAAIPDTPLTTLIEGTNDVWSYYLKVGHGTDDTGETGFCEEQDAMLHTDPRPFPQMWCTSDPSLVKQGHMQTRGSYHFAYAGDGAVRDMTMALVGAGTPNKSDRLKVTIRTYKGKVKKTFSVPKRRSQSLVRDGKRERWFGFTWLTPSRPEKKMDLIEMNAQRKVCRKVNGKRTCGWKTLLKGQF